MFISFQSFDATETTIQVRPVSVDLGQSGKERATAPADEGQLTARLPFFRSWLFAGRSYLWIHCVQ